MFEFGYIKNDDKGLAQKGVFRKRNLSLKNPNNIKLPDTTQILKSY